MFISHLASAYVLPCPIAQALESVQGAKLATWIRSNEFTLSANKKTIMPADVFAALDEIEYGFMRERLEAEFASQFRPLLSILSFLAT